MSWDNDEGTIYSDENGDWWCSVCGCLAHNCECETCPDCGEQKHVMSPCDNCESNKD